MTFELACKILRETDNAILVLDPASGEELWIPLSQVEVIHRHPDHAIVEMTDWIANKKGLDR